MFAFALSVAAAVAALLFLTRSVLRKPVLAEIAPSVGAPGDVLILRGQNFGDSRGFSYVELCGNRLTESGYVSWDDDLIKVIVPGNTEDGLVYVVTRAGKSNPEFFANELAIPVEMPENPMYVVPIISELSVAEASIGQVVSISGRNFGSSRGDSNVYFTTYKGSEMDEKIPDIKEAGVESERKSYPGFVNPSEADFDYEYWSDNEIRVRVPEGAVSGSVFVATNEGRSILQPFSVKSRAGQKNLTSQHTYLIQVGADFYDIKGSGDAAVTIHLPRPVTYAWQPQAALTESVPEPALLEYMGASIFQITPADKTSAKNSAGARQNFVVTSNGIVQYDGYQFQVFKQGQKNATGMGNNHVLCMAQARNGLFYFGTYANLIKRKKGDAYDFAVLYAALLRAAGVPCRMISGILIDADKHSRNHWWNEFYIEDFGWVPVDAALGAGMEFKSFQGESAAGKKWFANIDAQRVAFSLDYKVLKQSLLSDKTVNMPRSFALQSIWEESSADVESYSSYWTVPAVLGIY